jgi:hypothetical protein
MSTDYSFKIYYTDTIATGSTANDWANLPSEGVVAVLEYFGQDEFGYNLHSSFMGVDWYWFLNGRVNSNNDSSEIPGVWVEHTFPDNAIIKSGSWTSDEHINDVYSEIFSIVSSQDA